MSTMTAYDHKELDLDASPLLPPPSRNHAEIHDDDEDVTTRVGAWDAELFYPCESWVNCCTTYFLPCVSLAQISQRIGWAPYWKVIHTLLLVYPLELLMALVAEISANASTHARMWLSSLYDEHPRLVAAVVAGAASTSAVSFFFGSLSGFALAAVTLSLRGRVRALFDIPGSTFDDVVTSCCCSCYAIAQMASHVKSYDRRRFDVGPVDTLPGYALPTHRNVQPHKARLVRV